MGLTAALHRLQLATRRESKLERLMALTELTKKEDKRACCAEKMHSLYYAESGCNVDVGIADQAKGFLKISMDAASFVPSLGT